ncbi:MAG: hypothetical protein ACM33T_04895 [Solirubrobacterales bacterium]
MSNTAAAAKPVDKDAANRKEIVRTIKGPVVERLVKVIPALASYEDVYGTVIASPDLLYACVQLFRNKRELFQDLLVDAAGAPVTDDETPLKCERTVNQIVGMVVRSGAKAYGEKRFGAAPKIKQVVRPETKSLIDKLAALVGKKWETDRPKQAASAADDFYAAIKDNLDYDWQIPLIPQFAELPVKLIRDLGKGVTTLHNPEGLEALADIGRHNMEQARRILSDNMMREMLDTQPLAAKGIAFLGKDRYQFLHTAVYEKMGETFWQMCVDCERLEAMETQNAVDLEKMAAHLHIISGTTIEEIVRKLQPPQIPIVLDVARSTLGDEAFEKVFGVPGNKKVTKMFVEKIALTPLDPSKDPLEDLRDRLPAVFQAYLRDPVSFEKGL